MSIIQNLPSNAEPYNGTVEIVGDIDGFCKYENGRYCGATGCNNEGCTVGLPFECSLLRLSDNDGRSQ